MQRKYQAPLNPFMRGSTTPSVPVTLSLTAIRKAAEVSVVTPPTLTDIPDVPAGDIVARAMEEIVSPAEQQHLAGATSQELDLLEQQAMQQASTIMQDIVEGSAMGESSETRMDAQIPSVQGEPTDIETDADRLLQGEITPLLMKKEQEALS